jgi:hypothetical protein
VASQVGQQGVRLLQPLSFLLPSGMMVRQETTSPVLVPPSFAPVSLVSTRQTVPRLAPRRSTPEASAPRRLARSRLHPLHGAPCSVAEPSKSRLLRFLPGPGVQFEPEKQAVA